MYIAKRVIGQTITVNSEIIVMFLLLRKVWQGYNHNN